MQTEMDCKHKNDNYGGGELQLYLHIPFCARKCRYCDFLSFPADEETKREYMKALGKELKERAKEAEGYRVTGIFVGGGTPSVVDSLEMKEIFSCIKSNYHVTEDAEITMEVNPGTVDEEKAKCYLEMGINRISLGLQSTDNHKLEILGRIHTYEAFLESYAMLRKVGFTNINVDLMSALPEQTCEEYEEGLNKVLALTPPPQHISAYSLILEEGTGFFEMYERGELKLPSEDQDRLMYERTEEILLNAGFIRYEISNYALPGYECRHNVGYWVRKNYLGFGIGAASLMENRRFSNGSNLKEYIENPIGMREEEEMLTTKDQMEETMFLGLRLTKGVREDDFRKHFGCSFFDVYKDVIEKNIQDGLLLWEEGRLFLTKKGLDLSNYVMAQFLLEEE